MNPYGDFESKNDAMRRETEAMWLVGKKLGLTTKHPRQNGVPTTSI